MFTGIIEEVGNVDELVLNGIPNKIKVRCNAVVDDLKVGDSISVNGVCLTVNSFTQNDFVADIMPITVQKTNIKLLSKGSNVNLERAMMLNSRFGGHLVSGHIDSVGTIESINRDENAILIEIAIDSETHKFLVDEGSISVDGVSLTIAKLSSNSAIVSIIPHTFENTIFRNRRIGDLVNIEVDLIGKYVFKFQNKKVNRVTKNFLMENGFL
ncbi:MAG: riboflavin synthase [Candidatus Cloacimonadota bacterium]|nr:riboflavin synthase [Candidatus Cloacimonadota bacterium]